MIMLVSKDAPTPGRSHRCPHGIGRRDGLNAWSMTAPGRDAKIDLASANVRVCPSIRELSGDQMAITSTRSSSPVKSSPLRVYRSRPLACAVAAISRSANRLRGFRPSRTTAATTSP